ncbi:MAG: hypothetical protein FWD90_06200 [Defluviitaleaceae bacterium]|nr:hypothetical protein [Defluviitaleaceae bacterium]
MFHKPRLRNRAINGERAAYVVGVGCLQPTQPFAARSRSSPDCVQRGVGTSARPRPTEQQQVIQSLF